MTSISGSTSAASAWSTMNSSRAQGMQQRMFAKADTDGNGSVDKTELQTMLDKVAEKTGGTATSADDAFSTMDADGSGGIDAGELDAGIKRLMPAPSSTVDFARRPPPGEGPPPPQGADASSGSDSTDPLDTNKDGTVSDAERAAGDVNALMQQIFKAADANGDGTLGTSEADDLKAKVETAIDSMLQSMSATSSTASSSTASGPGSDASSDASTTQGAHLAALLDRVLKEYGASGSSAVQQAAGSSITTSA